MSRCFLAAVKVRHLLRVPAFHCFRAGKRSGCQALALTMPQLVFSVRDVSAGKNLRVGQQRVRDIKRQQEVGCCHKRRWPVALRRHSE